MYLTEKRDFQVFAKSLSFYQQVNSESCVKNIIFKLKKSKAAPEICIYVVYSIYSIYMHAYIYSANMEFYLNKTA